MITIPPDVVQMTATITGLQLNPIYGPDGTLRTIRVVAMATGTPPTPVPAWAQPNRRQPTPAEMAAINAVPLHPGELVVPAWLERASLAYMEAVYGDLIHPTTTPKGPREVQAPVPHGPPQRPQPVGRPVMRGPVPGQPHPVAVAPVPVQHPGQPHPVPTGSVQNPAQPGRGTPPHP